jgi:hypothetical protein
MGLDPRRASGSAQGRSAQTISELETRIARLENSTKGSILASGIALQTGGSLNVPISGAMTAIPGCTFTLNAQSATVAAVTALGTIAVFSNVNNSIYLFLDGIQQTGASGSTTVVGANSIVAAFRLALSAGQHTIDLRVQRAASAGSPSVLTSSAISYFQTRA